MMSKGGKTYILLTIHRIVIVLAKNVDDRTAHLSFEWPPMLAQALFGRLNHSLFK